MAKVTTARWQCDRCCRDGGVIDVDGTLPYRWLSLAVLVGTPQLDAEQRNPPTIHYCHECAETMLFHSLTSTSDEVGRLKSLWERKNIIRKETP